MLSLWSAGSLSPAEAELCRAIASDWRFDKASGKAAPATAPCRNECDEARRYALGCAYSEQYREAHEEGHVCWGYLRASPAWYYWTRAIRCAITTGDALRLPNPWFEAAEVYRANCK